MQIHSAHVRQLNPETVYEILRLRVNVFVVEQECPYPELDGRDLEPDCLWVWGGDGGQVSATLRLLTDPGGVRRIGRVATAAPARGLGAAAELMAYALDLVGDAESVLDAQSHLEHWYARFGYVPDGPRFLEDSVEHTPMRRTRRA